MSYEVLMGKVDLSKDELVKIDSYSMALVVWEILSRTALREGTILCMLVKTPYYNYIFTSYVQKNLAHTSSLLLNMWLEHQM